MLATPNVSQDGNARNYSPPPLVQDGKPTYIYALHDPTEISQRVYVGMTTKPLEKRIEQHLYPNVLARPTIRASWIRSLLARGTKPEIILLDTVPPGEDYQETERHWIASLRFMGVELVNGTDGGHGARGIIWTPEALVNLSKGQTGRKMSRESVERGAAKRTGKRIPREGVEKHAAALRGRKHSDQHRLKCIKARRKSTVRSALGFKGIKKNHSGYDARIGGQHIGHFKSAEDAARAYDSKARELWGVGAALNFPEHGELSARTATE